MPGHLYELLPIAVLIGTIYALARLAQSSEFTILRTGGLGPGRALGLLACWARCSPSLTFVVGDYVAPVSERAAVELKARFSRRPQARPRRRLAEGPPHAARRRERSYSVNVVRTTPDGVLRRRAHLRVRRRRPPASRACRRAPRVASATAEWLLDDAQVTHWPDGTGRPARCRCARSCTPSCDWPSTLDAGVVAAAVLPVSTMSTVELWRYIGHLASQEQAAQRHEIQFWKKALYPFACLVMMALALPFAYLQARAGGISLKVFGGIMLGISFVLLNNVAGHLGLLRDWTPWIVAAAPSALYLLLSLAAFSWLVRYR